MIDVPFSHDENASPSALPTGTLPEAMPPTAAPRQNGVITDDSANVAPSHRRRLAAQGERGSTEDDPYGGQPERHVERRGDRPEGGRERGPEDDEHEDEPHVVGLPHRAHRALDHPPHARAAPGAAGGEVPEAGAEVGAAEHGVGRQPGDDQRDADLGEAQAATSDSGGRRASRRSSHATAAMSMRYTIASTM